MKNIGMIVAVEIESVLNKYGIPIKKLEFIGYSVYQYKLGENNLFVIHTGAGQIAAATSTQFLISQFKVNFIVNFGIVGGLTHEMALARTCIVESVVHYDFDTSEADGCSVGRHLEYPSVYISTTKEIVDKALEIEPLLKKVICASGNKFIASKEKKEELHNSFNADICEMEAAGIILTCNKNKIPCLLIKTVSDSIAGGVSEFKNAINESARICMEITNKILNNL
ncbi:5'-methylthioadenosine/S-adenosylhomocysteine nucleosidase [Clostridium sp. CF011]|uniref:5'-methylthioadenosine/S-adenosylhomocysteine nucleosidase family protein n=1 Tax=Clostridium sp. CF011 TaxID=2843318 RepID=UPI001C0E3F05|nr:5'-methylthioadenosine/S-adenosylhomocysteine nucleosidase [Clostridium sp. CF011]MBU3092733.1 5'-methylthioadenosine/S-adenosylhomocysteine nucleosidase [Clostridium sp. CF011]WAG70565.1 5'-methylthioadenosine/S-adenosylhomocysteine nucleosidase [Clostridium sp. CF011]